jgi:hypothetical protein
MNEVISELLVKMFLLVTNCCLDSRQSSQSNIDRAEYFLYLWFFNGKEV